ncbi:MAG: DNA repair protein RadC [Fervidobacterium sp.]|nr:DNA repair protein RadC [Fervidobacterium sp.]
MVLKKGPREKLLNNGSESLSTEELIAILLRTGTRGRDVVKVSRELFEHFENSLYKMSKASFDEFKKIKGLGNAKIITLLATFELAKRLIKEEILTEDPRLNSPEKVFQYCIDMQILPQETVRVIFLDSKLNVISSKEISRGTITTSLAHPRDIFREAIIRNSTAIIMVHNHPSGDPTPSQEDVELTKRIKKAGELLGVSLVDHIVIGKTYFSLRQNCKEIGWENV